MLANVHRIIGIAIFQHPLSNGGRGMFLVGENTYLLNPLDECFIELWPRTSCQRDNTHIVIGHHQSVGQHLQRVKRRINHNFRLGHLPFDGICKTKEQRVATGEDNDSVLSDFVAETTILFEDSIEGNSDIYPLGISRQKRRHNLMMALATREHPTLLDDLHDLWSKPRLWIVRNADDDKLHSGSKFFTFHYSLLPSKGRDQV